MKYEVPEINISKFSMENIVTVSSLKLAQDAVAEAMGTTPSDSNIVSTKLTLDQWVKY